MKRLFLALAIPFCYLVSCAGDKPETDYSYHKPVEQGDDEDIMQGENPLAGEYEHLLPDTFNYKYWGSYNFDNNMANVQAQQWRAENHTIGGWDYSLPSSLEPADRSLLTIARGVKAGMEDLPAALPSLSYKINSAFELWLMWSEVEPVEGEYRWDAIEEFIKQTKSRGYNVVLRLLTSAHHRNGDRELGYAPKWLDAYDIPDIVFNKNQGGDNVECYDPAHPEFHKRYLKLVNAISETNIPDLVEACYVGYSTPSHGDEGIAPYGVDPDTTPHVRERIEAWADVFKGQTSKMYMGGPSNYGFELGFGIRRGFAEIYWYEIPQPVIGQYVDKDGYLCVDESVHVIKNNTFNGEELEEFEPYWITAQGGYRYGTSTRSFTYRYFMSFLRALQMRCSYILIDGNLIPEMVPFISQETGRTIEDTPDIWSFMCETRFEPNALWSSDPKYYRPAVGDEKCEGIAVKHLERWLYQRDSKGYETTPSHKILHPRKMWMIQEGMNYDYIAREGAKIGFYADDRFESDNSKALKVSYFDDNAGEMIVKYHTKDGGEGSVSVKLTGDSQLKTTTFILDDISLNASGDDYDFVIEAGGEAQSVCVSWVRVVKA